MKTRTDNTDVLLLDRGAHAARVLDSAASPNSSTSPVALIDMTVPQLTEANVMLDTMAIHHDSANTVCRLLQGIVFIELKTRIGHKNWGAWLKENYRKSHDTAGRCMRAATDFLAKLQDRKFRSTAEFDLQKGVDLLRQDLAQTLEQLGKASLDLSHPLVRAAAVYAKGRSFYQLCLDLGPGSLGGDTSAHRKKLTPAEAEKQFLAEAKEDFSDALMSLDRIHDKRIWQAPSITDSMLEQSIELAREFAREAAAWLRTPKRERAIPPAETFAS